MEEVLYECENGVGWIRLNRPKTINSLSADMVHSIYEKLVEWKEDHRVAVVCVSGEGEKGLCAGGDMKSLYDKKNSNVLEAAYDFFLTEYRMNLLMHSFPKPILVFMDGIVMGGGVGIAIAASHRIVTEKTKWSMPEMNIGFFPDVGGSYFLNQMPGSVGRYLALTTPVIKASDVLYIGAADHYISSGDWQQLKTDIGNGRWTSTGAAETLTEVIKKYEQPVPPSELAAVQANIDRHFAHETMEDMASSLEQAKQSGDAWAAETKKVLMSKSPLSLKVALRQLQLGARKSLVDCFKMEFALGVNFMKNPDFYEGVRSVLVDKDRNPKWTYPRFEDVTEELVSSFFAWNPKWTEQGVEKAFEA